MQRVYSGLTALAMLALAMPSQAATLAPVRTAHVTLAPVRNASPTMATGFVNDMSLPGATKLVQDYFNGLTTMQAHFTQTATGDHFTSEGTFYLSKPGKFLWQYETPNRQKIISTGTAVYYQNQDNGQVTQLPTNAGMARLFNSQYLNLAKQGLKVTGVESSPSVIVVTLELDKRTFAEDQAGVKSIKIVFERLPMGMVQIHEVDVLDALQATTKVTFSEIKNGVRFDRKMFDFTPGVYKEN